MLIFNLHTQNIYPTDQKMQIALRPSMVNRVITRGENLSTIYVRVGNNNEEHHVVEHSVEEIVAAFMKVEDYF